MELRQLRYFTAIVEEGTLTRAAQLLGLGTSALSEQTLALEREMGTALFRRTSTGMVPTQAGRALLPHARTALAASRAAEQAVRDAASVPRWRVGVTPGSPHAVVDALWERLRAHGVDAEPVDASTAEQVEAVRRGTWEAGLVCLPVDGHGLETAVVSDVPLGVLTSAGHPLAGAGPLEWDALAGQELLWFPRDLAPGYHDAVMSACHAAGWWPRLRARPPRRALFTAELRSGEGELVALRPRTSLDDGAGLAWRPLTGAPRLRHAVVWRGGDEAAGEDQEGPGRPGPSCVTRVMRALEAVLSPS